MKTRIAIILLCALLPAILAVCGDQPSDGDRGPEARPGRGERGPNGRPGEGPPSGEDLIRRLDRDGDGRISREEFDGPADHFGHLDRDEDGFITGEEAAVPPPRPGR
jgi:EF hand